MKKKMYIHSEMLHPSMQHLHLGHIRSHIYGDILRRYYVNNNYDVIFCNKYDVFGYLPDHWALVNNKNPLEYLMDNIKSINKDFDSINIKFTNKRNILTSDNKYVNYTQNIFRYLYKDGYIYKQRDFVIKCNKCNRILCNEEVSDNKCIWCNKKINYDFIDQYFIDINKLSKSLIFRNKNCFDDKTITMHNKMLKNNTCYKARINFNDKRSFIDVYLKNNYLTNVVKVPYSLRIINKLWDYMSDKKKKEVIECLRNNREYKEVKIDIDFNDIEVYLTFWSNDILTENCGKKIILNNLSKASYNQIPDWNITRIRNWGERIPLLNCQNCDYEQINDDDISGNIFNTSNKSKYICPKCGNYLVENNNVLSPWLSSSWDIYYPFLMNKRINYELSKEYKYANYNFTREAHITKHIFYTRFITKFLYNKHLIGFNEPVKYNCYVGNLSTKDGTMSRIRGNSVYINDLLKQYSSDAIRLGLISSAKYRLPIIFNESYIKGSTRLINRLLNLNININNKATFDYNDVIDKLNKYYQKNDFDKIYSIVQKITLILEKESIKKKTLIKLLKLMEPVIPETIRIISKKYNNLMV